MANRGMAPFSTPTSAAEQGYHEALAQRTELNHNSTAAGDHHAESNFISQTDLDNLRSIAAKYENLRRNLLRGGVGEEVIELLSQGDSAIQSGSLPNTTNGQANPSGPARPANPFHPAVPRRKNSVRKSFSRFDGGGNVGFGSDENSRRGLGHADSTFEPEDDCCDGEKTPDSSRGLGGQFEQQNQRPQFDRQCTRTVLLTNLSEATTHADITAAIRGGFLLDVFLRTQERAASVSFLHAVDARAFFAHVRKHDLYIKNKRVDIKWCDRQFILPGHVASKIGSGATRNLIIRQIDNRHTEQSIRDDLDHIHNLVVVKVDFDGSNCYVKTNSVHNALYAKMCMMSRSRYKHTRIEWDLDECAQPYEKFPTPKTKPKKEAPPARKNSTFAPNRFHLLNLDDDDEDDISATFQSKKTVGIIV